MRTVTMEEVKAVARRSLAFVAGLLTYVAATRPARFIRDRALPVIARGLVNFVCDVWESKWFTKFSLYALPVILFVTMIGSCAADFTDGMHRRDLLETCEMSTAGKCKIIEVAVPDVQQ